MTDEPVGDERTRERDACAWCGCPAVDGEAHLLRVRCEAWRAQATALVRRLVDALDGDATLVRPCEVLDDAQRFLEGRGEGA